MTQYRKGVTVSGLMALCDYHTHNYDQLITLLPEVLGQGIGSFGSVACVRHVIPKLIIGLH